MCLKVRWKVIVPERKNLLSLACPVGCPLWLTLLSSELPFGWLLLQSECWHILSELWSISQVFWDTDAMMSVMESGILRSLHSFSIKWFIYIITVFILFMVKCFPLWIHSISQWGHRPGVTLLHPPNNANPRDFPGQVSTQVPFPSWLPHGRIYQLA